MVQKYFNQLNYTLGNEDTSVDLELIRRLGSQKVFSVAGCGSRSFPLLESASSVDLVDVSEYQLSLCRLREALYRNLSFNEFLLFFDYPPYHGQNNIFERKRIFLSLELESRDRDFFRNIFEEISWESPLYQGKWERTFQKMSYVLRALLGKNYKKIFEFHDLDEQIYFFENEFSKLKWNSLLFLLGNKSVFNALLYKGDFIEKNVEENHFEYYQTSFNQLFLNNLARSSFFAHLCFFGKITHSDGNPIEAVESNFLAVKDKLEGGAKVQYHQGDLVGLLGSKEFENKYDFLGLSDVPSYFKGDLEKTFLQTIRSSLQEGGIICLRNYLRIPNSNNSGLEDISHQFQSLFLNEKVGVYRFQILKKI
jgi:S-adenosylmethionine-diacylglycerol 3-amino-3-carboxypropyl transferase